MITDEILARVKELKLSAIGYYNECNFTRALNTFTEAYDAMYKTFPKHVEVGKLQKSMDSCTKNIRGGKDSKRGNEEDSTTTGNPVLDKLRLKLIQRGAKGIIGLSKKFRIIDDVSKEMHILLLPPNCVFISPLYLLPVG